MTRFRHLAVVFAAALLCLRAGEAVTQPFVGVTHIHRTETSPRSISIHIVKIDLSADGLSFKLTSGGGSRETVRQTTLDFLNQERAQIAINGHFFLPFPSPETDSDLIGLAASKGEVISGFETPSQSYALVANAPALNIDAENRASIVHRHADDAKRASEEATLWTAVSGSAQIVTDGVRSIPVYKDDEHPDGLLTPGGTGNYSNSKSWYEVANSRTVVGLSEDSRTLFLFTVDNAGGSRGMTLAEVADMLIGDYGVFQALNLDGGGSTTLVFENESTRVGEIVNVSSDNPKGRSVASNLAVFARRPPQE